MTKDVFICSGRRTPFGDFGKSLKGIEGTELAIHATKSALEANSLAPEKIDHIVCGNVIPVGQGGLFASRVIGLGSGMRQESAALNVSRACGSGTQAIVSAAEQIMTGHSQLAVATGYENASRAPYVMENARWGFKRGADTLVDMIDYAYRDPFELSLMGETAENLTEDFGYVREEMDDYALTSQQRAGEAMNNGFLARQITPIEVQERKSVRLFDQDEFPRPTVTREKLATLRPAFRDGGQVTAGNSSGLTDGAASVVIADATMVKAEDLDARARIVDWEVVGVAPRIMGCGPVPAIDRLLKRRDMTVDNIDYFEINEAFAVVNLHAEKQLNIPRDRTNLYGGGISIGHPPGATGIRMALTALDHLADSQGQYAILSMCLGAGQGMAVLIEAV